MALITQREYARRLGKTPQYVNKLVAQGRIALVNRKIDPVKADRALRRSVSRPKAAAQRKGRDKARNPKPETRNSKLETRNHRHASDTGSLTAARRRHEEAKAKLAELELAEKSRNLLPRAEVLEALRRHFASLRTRLLSLPSAMAAPLAAATAPAEVQAALTAELRRLCDEHASSPLAIVPAAEAEAAVQAIAPEPVAGVIPPPPAPAVSEVHV